jgi:hypothetical protein
MARPVIGGTGEDGISRFSRTKDALEVGIYRRKVNRVLDARQPRPQGVGATLDTAHRPALPRAPGVEPDGRIQLPAPTTVNANRRWPLRLPPGPTPPEVRCELAALGGVHLRRLRRRHSEERDTRLWNGLVARHHYLGYSPLPRAQLRYFIEDRRGQILGLFGFGAAAWKCQPRDSFIRGEGDCRFRSPAVRRQR